MFLMFSDNPHFWCDPARLQQLAERWEMVKIGNCGSPMETEAGWLVLTHCADNDVRDQEHFLG